MAHKRSLLFIQVLSFLLVTLLGVATGNLTGETGSRPWGLDVLRRGSLPLAGVIVMMIIGLMVWQHLTEERLALPARPIWDSDRSPFPGLEAFTEQDSAVFFGRDAEIADLVDRLHPVVAGQVNRLITVVGPSGAGKSSLVQAGVVPRLRQRRRGWIIVPPMVPGDHPLRSLALSLITAGSGCTSTDVPAVRFAEELRTAVRRPNTPVLVIIDQAEELFALGGQGERNEFLDLLANALAADQRLWIILIMRTEFLNAFLDTEHARLFRDPVTVGTLSHVALIEVIEQPARRAGLTFDPPDLPQRMAAEAGSGAALPLLAYALQELYLVMGRPMTAVAYERIGGVAGVLTRQADKVATELGGTDPSGPVLETLLKFVTIAEDEPTRRRVRRSTLTEDQWRVAEAFLAARLLTSTVDGDDAILEVAHEALFRSWAPLRQAIAASTDQLRWRADLERWARDWEKSGRQDAYLLHDERLKAAQRWASSGGEMVDDLPLVAEFLDCSNRADRATMQRLSEAIARQALGSVDSDPDYSLLLALTAIEECASTALAVRALTAAVVVSQVRVVLRGHGDGVLRIAWSPDSKRLATVSSDRTVRIWDASSGNNLAVLHGHDDWVRGVAWSPDGRRLATGSNDRTVRIWDASSGNNLAALHGHDDEVWGVVWSPDHRCLATVSRDRTIRIWNASSGSELMVLRGHNDWVRGAAWSPDGRRLATGSYDQTARIWDIDSGSGSELMVLRGHNDWVQSVAWSPDGRRLATASHDHTTRIWDIAGRSELVVLRGHNAEVREVAWSPDGRRLATGSIDRTARIWNADSGNELTVLQGHNGWIRGVAWSPDSQLLATASSDGTARVWDTRGNNELAALYGHHSGVQTVAWSPDGRRLATGSYDRTARIWDADNGGELAVLPGHNDEVRAVAWSPDGRQLATASNDRTARIWDTQGYTELAAYDHDSWVQAVTWSPDGRRLATASFDGTVRILDADTGGELAVLHGHNAEVRAVAWSPHGQQVVTASNDRTVRIWDADNGAEITLLGSYNDWIRVVAWSPDGRRLATASRDRTTRIWDADNGGELVTLRGYSTEVRGLSWSPDGRRLATGSRDGTVRIWDTQSGVEIIVVGAHFKGVESVAWSPNGKRIASASEDGTCRIWDATLSFEDLLANAHRRVSRELSVEERHHLMLPSVGRDSPLVNSANSAL